MYLRAPRLRRIVTVHKRISDCLTHGLRRIVRQVLTEDSLDYASDAHIASDCPHGIRDQHRNGPHQTFVVEEALLAHPGRFISAGICCKGHVEPREKLLRVSACCHKPAQSWH